VVDFSCFRTFFENQKSLYFPEPKSSNNVISATAKKASLEFFRSNFRRGFAKRKKKLI
jgi:hypothetical protein